MIDLVLRAFNYWNSYKTCLLSVLETMGLGLQQGNLIARHSTNVNSSQVSKAHYCIAMYNIAAIAIAFPSDTLVQQNFPYSIHHHTNFAGPFACTEYRSFAPSLVSPFRLLIAVSQLKVPTC